MSDTPRTSLPLLAAAQAQKHVTHNEALYQIDALTCANILDRDLSAPPANPADGDTYLVKATATAAWAGQDGKIAFCADGSWRFYAPFAGLIAYVADENALIVYSGSNWLDFSSMVGFQNLPMVGVNTTANSTNRLSAKTNAALFAALDASGGGTGDIRATLSKEAAANTASFLFQDDYSGRAEIGLAGDDDFHLKVSPDGASWNEAIKIANATGALSLLPGGLLGGGRLKSFQYFTAGGTWTRPSGIRFALVEVIGAGGGGGGVVSPASGHKGAGGGGGGGGYARSFIDVSSISSETVTIGSGGTQGNGSAGGDGGASSFGSLLSASGGAGGSAMTADTAATAAASGTGGTGSGGDLNSTGSPGGIGFIASATAGFSGHGGASILGGGGISKCGTNAVGDTALSPGAGGGGALTNSATNRAGGAGADGLVIVWEFE